MRYFKTVSICLGWVDATLGEFEALTKSAALCWSQKVSLDAYTREGTA